ncbi:hypothetical protein CLIB1444_04S07866 [[Candida] jaroonii]|uniref:Uncharacterized protein n=1 Tax=[Candida] jaroonii TaxID=467808 RepID=A0ACA9Y723_9ASCO|nr:hypothetical protein CLIB1444_04S07866 [[Candida] jaroonii]
MNENKIGYEQSIAVIKYMRERMFLFEIENKCLTHNLKYSLRKSQSLQLENARLIQLVEDLEEKLEEYSRESEELDSTIDALIHTRASMMTELEMLRSELRAYQEDNGGIQIVKLDCGRGFGKIYERLKNASTDKSSSLKSFKRRLFPNQTNSKPQ